MTKTKWECTANTLPSRDQSMYHRVLFRQKAIPHIKLFKVKNMSFLSINQIFSYKGKNQKMFKIMKTSFIIAFACLLNITASVYSQNT